MRSKLCLLILAVVLLLPATSFAKSDLQKKFTDDELVQILRGEGYGSIEKRRSGVVVFKVDGQTYALYNTYDGDLQCYYGIGGAEVSYKAINEWNKTKRLSRAYLDKDEDPVLESDLLSDAGLNKEHVARFVKIFVFSAKQFKDYVNDKSN